MGIGISNFISANLKLINIVSEWWLDLTWDNVLNFTVFFEASRTHTQSVLDFALLSEIYQTPRVRLLGLLECLSFSCYPRTVCGLDCGLQADV